MNFYIVSHNNVSSSGKSIGHFGFSHDSIFWSPPLGIHLRFLLLQRPLVPNGLTDGAVDGDLAFALSVPIPLSLLAQGPSAPGGPQGASSLAAIIDFQ